MTLNKTIYHSLNKFLGEVYTMSDESKSTINRENKNLVPPTGKELIIAEKPSVARDIAKVLKCNSRRDGYIEGESHIITWAIGHLITLSEPEDYDPKYKKWDFKTLPILPNDIRIKPYEKTKKQLGIITNLVNREDVVSLICATDSGREGELIFRYIYEYTGSKKSFKRLWISSMTDEAIQTGFDTLKDGKAYDDLYYSAKCRSESDWLVGINATRAYTTKNHVLLSVGRVQTPTLGLIVNRYHEIENFTPQDYWEVQSNYGEFTGTWFEGKVSESKILEKEKAEAIAAKIIDQIGVVKKLTNKKNKLLPPLLYDLTELQRDGNRYYGFTAQNVLTIAQNLYEKRKLLTYPRTDSRYLSDDMKDVVKNTMHKINIPPFNTAVSSVLEKGLKFSKRIIDNKKVTDHHAIIPTNIKPNLNGISEDELKIYKLVVKRFIAVFMDTHLFNTAELVVDVCDETFVSKGKVITQQGWKKLYKSDKDNKDVELPVLKKGEEITIVGSELLTKKTSAPKPYSEATLLSAMENAGRFVEEEELKEQLKESGFGTAATRAGIIERLIQVEYIRRKGKSLYPTPKGVKLIAIVPEELKSPVTTGKWERGLTKIAKGELESEKFMNSISKFVIYLVGSANKTSGKVLFEQKAKKGGKAYVPKGPILGQCPLCEDGKITENSKSYYCTNWRSGCKMTIWKNVLERYGKEINPEMVKVLLEKGEIKPYRIRLPQTGEEKTATLTLSDQGQVKLLNMHPVIEEVKDVKEEGPQ